MKNKIILLLLISWLISPPCVLAAGIQVSPSSLEFNNSQDQNITVLNPTADVQIFEAYPDEFENIIKAYPKSFTLEPGAQKQIRISIETDTIAESKIISTNLSVLGRPLLEERFTVNTGIKIPVSINLNQTGAQNNFKYKWLIAGLALAALLGMAIKRFSKTGN